MISLVLDAVYLIKWCLLLILEERALYTILFVIIAFLPLLLFTAAMKETQNIAKGAVRGLIFFTFLQPRDDTLGLKCPQRLARSGLLDMPMRSASSTWRIFSPGSNTRSMIRPRICAAACRVS